MRSIFYLVALLVLSSRVGLAQSISTTPIEGLHQSKPEWLILEGGVVHLDSQRVLEGGSVLVQGTRIVEVGVNLQPPPGVRRIAVSGKHIYPAFIDAYVPVSLDKSELIATAYWNRHIRPDRSAAKQVTLPSLKLKEWRLAGFGAAALTPNSGIVQGKSAVFLLSGESAHQNLLKPDVGMAMQLTQRLSAPGEDRGEGGPTSPMGAYALARQVMFDARWYGDAWRIARSHAFLPRPEVNESLALLQPLVNGEMPAIVRTSNEIFELRAARFAREFGLRLILIGNGLEYRRLPEIAGLGVPIILPVDFPDPPDLASPMDALAVSLEDLMHWDHAPENPGRLALANVKLAFSALGLDSPQDFLRHIRLAVKRGLPEAAALQGMTEGPAEILGVSDQLGTLEKGKISNLIVTDGPLFEDKTRVLATLVAGEYFEAERTSPRTFDGLWVFEGAGEVPAFSLGIKTKPKASVQFFPTDSALPDSKPKSIKKFKMVDTQLIGIIESDEIGLKGKSLFSLALDEAERGFGTLRAPDGRQFSFSVRRTGEAPDPAPTPDEKGTLPEKADAPNSTNQDGIQDSERLEDVEWDQIILGSHQHLVGLPHTHLLGGSGYLGQQESSKEGPSTSIQDNQKLPLEPASFPVNFPFGDFGRLALPDAPEKWLIRNVTIWTCGPLGKLEGGAVLIEKGLITQVFSKGQALPEAPGIDGQGMHLTPGLIDCHSHMASDSGINEVGQAITAEVRIGDFIDCDDITIYRQLAGGLTTSNILHGSANPIGGQNQVIKLRWGLNDEQMKFAEAPAGIKFALGENVKQSNRRSSEPATRYPQTRMGVEQIMHDSFRAAQEYIAAHDKWKRDRLGLPPRVDLELEALAEILTHQRWIHCHSYRQDEILALIKVLEQYQITIGSFQHILEGYKVADAIAKHGGMASAFSDWWAYKYEVIDGIPQAGALMHAAGVVVSFNSDDNELARHMNHEAAKAVRYGDLSEEEALKFVTLNPAKQLRIDQFVGSIEVGKHADFVLWSGHPLDTRSRCEQTWIDGRKYFDRSEAEDLAKAQASQRAVLIQKALQFDSGRKPSRAEELDESLLWPRFDEYCHEHGHSHGGE